MLQTHNLKVLMVLRPAQGGMREHVRLLMRGIRYRCILVVAGPPDPEMREEVLSLDGEYYDVNISPGLSPLDDWRTSNYLAHLNSKFHFDIIHAHGFKASVPARLAAWRTGIPGVVYTSHNMVDQNWTGLRRKIYWKMERSLAKVTDKLIVVSEAMKERFIQEGIPASRVELVHNGISLKPYELPLDREAKRAQLGVAPGQTMIVCPARLIPSKGVDLLLEAVRKMGETRSLNSLQVLVLGDGPLRAELENSAATLGLKDTVRFLGHRKDMPEVLKAADLFVLPSLAEGLPLSILEAMAAGCPVVASNVGGIPDAIRHGENGFLVNPGDAGALARALEFILSNPERRQAYASQARQNAITRFSSERMVEDVYRIYETCLMPFTEIRPPRFRFYKD